MTEEFTFGAPPFDATAALATMKRTLRDAKLVERDGQFEFKGSPVATARIDGAAIVAQVARKPLRMPEWETKTITNHAELRRFTDDLKKRLAKWADGRSED